MKKGKSLLATILIGAVTAASLSGCGSSREITFTEGAPKTELTFSWWGSDARNEYTIAAVREFEKQHPDIKVRLEYSEFAGFENKTDVKMKAHREADIMQLNYAWVSKYSPDGTGFYDLNKLSDTLNLGNYDDDVLAYGMIDGKLNDLPIAQNSHVCMYNKNIYDKYGLDIPDSWEDLYAAAEVMGKDGIYPFDMGGVAMWFVCVAHEEQMNGKEILTEDEQLNFTQEDLEEMISFYVDLVDKGVVEDISKRTDTDLADGSYAGTVQWINSVPTFDAYVVEAGGTSVIGKVPVLEGASRTGWYVRPATVYAISANTAHPKEAAMFLEYLVAGKEMAEQQLLDKGIPFNKSAKAVLEESGDLQGLMNDAANEVDATETYLMEPKFETSKLSAIFTDACVSVLYGGATPAEAADTAYDLMVEDLGG